MTIKYEFGGTDYESGYYFEYEISNYDLKQFVEHELYETARVAKGESEPVERIMRELIDIGSYELIEELANQFEEDLKDYFEQKALEKWKEQKEN